MESQFPGAAKLVPSRSNRRGYSVNTGVDIVDGCLSETDEILQDGLIIAIEEDVDHDRRLASYTASTADHFAVRREASPHLNLTAWFFKLNGAKWDFVGFGESLDSLWEKGTFAEPKEQKSPSLDMP